MSAPPASGRRGRSDIHALDQGPRLKRSDGPLDPVEHGAGVLFHLAVGPLELPIQAVEQALANNRDLRQTLLNVQTARAAYRVQRADQLPGLEAQASGNRQRLPADLSGTGAARVQSNYQAGAGLMAFEM